MTDTEAEMGKLASQFLLKYMLQPKRVNIAITGGTSPVSVYEELVPNVKNKDYFKNVHYYNFDEIPYKNEDQEGVTISELRKLYFNPANISENQIHKLDQFNYKEQDNRIKNDGGIDLMFIGVGNDGHYCGNLPGTTKFGDKTSKVKNDQRLKDRLVDEFNGQKEKIPDYYITMGPRSIMASRNILMIATGIRKREIIKRLMNPSIDENIPATLLTLHPNFTLIADKDACSLL